MPKNVRNIFGHDFEDQNRAYTESFYLFNLTAFGVSSELTANVLLPRYELAPALPQSPKTPPATSHQPPYRVVPID
ncbi:hypothetical protein K0I73_14100 [Shewanella mesophila]|uniref:hypothetical protein n=1 Tax=Shewanella mesophila TaxID=2864208 RepID=UPI001C655D00|nr:hypothetical protein [Shewanella mesophila]QYJ85325.1 hypothetical protein K0I73_14100 [Shewanella mesophila]